MVDGNIFLIEVIVILFIVESFQFEFGMHFYGHYFQTDFSHSFNCMYATRLRVDFVILWRNSWFHELTIKTIVSHKTLLTNIRLLFALPSTLLVAKCFLCLTVQTHDSSKTHIIC